MKIAPTEIRSAAAAGAPGGALAVLLAGKVIEARLVMATSGGLFRFTSSGTEFDLPLPRDLPPGTQVRITPQPGGAVEITVLAEEGLPTPAARPGAVGTPVMPPVNLTVRPVGPMPDLPVGILVEAKVTGAPREGVVRVALPGGEVDLPLPRPVSAGTPIRITLESSGALRVGVPPTQAPSAPAVAMGNVAALPLRPVAHPFVFTVRPEGPMPSIADGQVIEAHVLAPPREGVVRFSTPAGEVDLALPKTFPEGTPARLAPQPNGTLVVTVRTEPPAAAPAAPVSVTVPQPDSPIVLKPGPGLPALPPNQIIDARVAAAPQPNGMVRFTSPAGTFDLPLAQPLPPGMPVHVMARPDGGLTLVPMVSTAEAGAVKPQATAASAAEVVRTAARAAVARQDGLAPLFTKIEEVAVRPDTPVPVRHAAGEILDQRLPLDFVTKPEQIARAVAASGLFAERTLASLVPAKAAPPDLKLALYILRAALGSWTSARTDGPIRPEAHLPPPAPGMPPAAQSPPDTRHPHAAGQGMASLSPEEMVPRLLGETDAALARINLHQIASLPDERMAARADQPDMRWSCEIPVNVDGRTAMFGFVIERDGRHAPQEREKRRWRVRAAIDLAETGAVEADVRLQGGAVSAGLLVERSETAEVLEAALPMLRDGLTAAGFDVDSLSVRTGRAVPQPGPPGYFVDRMT